MALAAARKQGSKNAHNQILCHQDLWIMGSRSSGSFVGRQDFSFRRSHVNHTSPIRRGGRASEPTPPHGDDFKNNEKYRLGPSEDDDCFFVDRKTLYKIDMMISSRILLLWLSFACCALLSAAIGPVESLSSRQLGMFAFLLCRINTPNLHGTHEMALHAFYIFCCLFFPLLQRKR
jgi:hypothetical protein